MKEKQSKRVAQIDIILQTNGLNQKPLSEQALQSLLYEKCQLLQLPYSNSQYRN